MTDGYFLPYTYIRIFLIAGGDHPYRLLQCIQDACYLSYTDDTRLDMPKHNTLPNANKDNFNESGELKRNMKTLNLKAKEHLRLMSQLDYQHQVNVHFCCCCYSFDLYERKITHTFEFINFIIIEPDNGRWI